MLQPHTDDDDAATVNIAGLYVLLTSSSWINRLLNVKTLQRITATRKIKQQTVQLLWATKSSQMTTVHLYHGMAHIRNGIAIV